MITTLAVRVFQLLFSIVVLALSVVLIKTWGPARPGYSLEKPYPIIGYGAFVGGAGVVIAIVGIAACFIDVLAGVVMLALDSFAILFVVAGGIAYAVKTGVGSCDDWNRGSTQTTTYIYKHLNPFSPSQNKYYPDASDNELLKTIYKDIAGRCRIFQAETAFIWFMFALFCVSIVLTFLNKTNKRSGGIV